VVPVTTAIHPVVTGALVAMVLTAVLVRLVQQGLAAAAAVLAAVALLA
jgi:hypothetical protein